MPNIEVNGKKIHYIDEGNGEVLLLGHSYLWNYRMWEEQIKVLSHSYRCIAPDLWGHGDSDVLSDQEYSVSHLADDFWALMQRLGIDTFSVIGLSVGGMWAFDLALKHMDAVKSLTLMDTYLGEESQETKAQYYSMLDTVEKAGAIPEAMLEPLMPLFFSPYTLTTNSYLVEQFCSDLKAFSPRQIPTIVTLGRAIFSRPDRLNQLNTLSLPTLIVVGEHDRSRPVVEAKEMVDLIPGAQLKIISEAGHICTKEQPKAVNKEILEFLANC